MGKHYIAVNPSSVKLTYNDSDKKWHAGMNSAEERTGVQIYGKWSGSRTGMLPTSRPKSLGGFPVSRVLPIWEARS